MPEVWSLLLEGGLEELKSGFGVVKPEQMEGAEVCLLHLRCSAR